MLRIIRLRVEQLRILQALELADLGSRVWLVGPNGSGKTSILEALFLLGHGRSFRRGGSDALLRRGSDVLSVFAELERDSGNRRLGLSRSVAGWQARLDGEAVASRAELFRQFPVLAFEPDSHALVAGGGEERRRYLDWGLFHVEPDFLLTWRRFHRALKQRNALLKQRDAGGLAVWNRELASWGGALDAFRRRHVAALAASASEMAASLAPELEPLRLTYQQGWRGEQEGLEVALAGSVQRDLLHGHTTLGPQRGDVSIRVATLEGREQLSRGQQKLVALLLKLAQGEVHARLRGSWPVLLLDDLASELDESHYARCRDLLERIPAQCWLSGTRAPATRPAASETLFHVEQGRVTRLL